MYFHLQIAFNPAIEYRNCQIITLHKVLDIFVIFLYVFFVVVASFIPIVSVRVVGFEFGAIRKEV